MQRSHSRVDWWLFSILLFTCAAALTNPYSRQLRNLNPGRRAPAHLIGDDLARYGAVDLAGNPMTHRAQRDPQLR